jgi:hypothetical protein
MTNIMLSFQRLIYKSIIFLEFIQKISNDPIKIYDNMNN